MGWLLWAFASAAVLSTGYVVACRAFPDRSLPERLVVTWLTAVSIALLAMLACGAAALLTRGVLAPVVLVLCAGVVLCACRGWPWRQHLAKRLRSDLAAPVRLGAEVLRTKDPILLVAAPGAVAFTVVVLCIWYFKSWSWDATWYHAPMVAHIVGTGSLEVIRSHILQMTFPRNAELLAVWNCIFPMDNRLDDSAQVGFLAAGALLTMAWCRRLGASRGSSVAMAGTWLALPPVWLVAHVGNIDVVTAVCLASGIYFLSSSAEPRDLLVAAAGFGIYVGAKYHGLLHLVVLAPWILVRIVQALRRSPRRRQAAAAVLCAIAVFAGLGSYFYVQNARAFGNPVHPIPLRIPLIGVDLPGVTSSLDFPGEAAILAGKKAKPFFGEPDALEKMVKSWFNERVDYIPDVKSGGFGPSFRWLLLPAFLLTVICGLLPSGWRRLMPLGVLFGAALIVPMAWWPRFILAAPLAAVVGFAWLYGRLSTAWFRLPVAGALLVLTVSGLWASIEGSRAFNPFPSKLTEAMRATPLQRASFQLAPNLWPTRWNLEKEHELRPGDWVTYDESGYFISELWTRDFRNRVAFVSSRTDPEGYATRLRRLRPRWAGVREGSAAAKSLAAAGATFLFVAPRTRMAVYRMPWADAGPHDVASAP